MSTIIQEANRLSKALAANATHMTRSLHTLTVAMGNAENKLTAATKGAYAKPDMNYILGHGFSIFDHPYFRLFHFFRNLKMLDIHQSRWIIINATSFRRHWPNDLSSAIDQKVKALRKKPAFALKAKSLWGTNQASMANSADDISSDVFKMTISIIQFIVTNIRYSDDQKRLYLRAIATSGGATRWHAPRMAGDVAQLAMYLAYVMDTDRLVTFRLIPNQGYVPQNAGAAPKIRNWTLGERGTGPVHYLGKPLTAPKSGQTLVQQPDYQRIPPAILKEVNSLHQKIIGGTLLSTIQMTQASVQAAARCYRTLQIMQGLTNPNDMGAPARIPVKYKSLVLH